MMINIYGGNNLIAPVASSAIQNFMATGVMRPPTNRKILRNGEYRKCDG